MLTAPFCSRGFGVGFLNTEPNRLFGALGFFGETKNIQVIRKETKTHRRPDPGKMNGNYRILYIEV